MHQKENLIIRLGVQLQTCIFVYVNLSYKDVFISGSQGGNFCKRRSKKAVDMHDQFLGDDIPF